MNKTLYNTAMEKITMSNECEERILDAINDTQQIAVKKRKKIRFAPVMAAAAILVTGTISVAAENGGFDWIRGFFTRDDFEMTNDVTDIVADISNFTCESDMGIELSPIGMIGDETTLYCMFNVDSFPEDIKRESLQLNRFYTDTVPSIHEIAEHNPKAESLLTEEDFLDGFSCGFSTEHDEENNIAIFKMETSYNAFNDGDNVTLELGIVPEIGGFYCGDPEADICATLNFDIKFGNIRTLEVNYDEYKAVEVYNTKFFIENMKITPLKVTTIGTEIVHYSMTLNNDLTFIMKDKSIVTASHNGFNASASIKTYSNIVASEWTFDSPINPDNIMAVYLDELCLYSTETTE